MMIIKKDLETFHQPGAMNHATPTKQQSMGTLITDQGQEKSLLRMLLSYKDPMTTG